MRIRTVHQIDKNSYYRDLSLRSRPSEWQIALFSFLELENWKRDWRDNRVPALQAIEILESFLGTKQRLRHNMKEVKERLNGAPSLNTTEQTLSGVQCSIRNTPVRPFHDTFKLPSR